MQKQFTETWNKFYEVMSQPMTDWTELQLNTLQNISRQTGNIEEFKQAKTFEDLMLTIMKFTSIAQIETLAYAKKSSDIWLRTIEQFQSISKDTMKSTGKWKE